MADFAIVCLTRCEPCMFGSHFDPPEQHPWMGEDDAVHAGHAWPLPQEIADANPCACRCAGGPGGCHVLPAAAGHSRTGVDVSDPARSGPERPVPDAFRVLVTGSRTWKDDAAVHDALMDAIPYRVEPGRDYVIVHGACPEGADAMAAQFCENEAGWVDNAGSALYAEPHPVTRADWDTCAPSCDLKHRRTRRDGTTYCPAAALRRDAHMVSLGAQLCVAFIDPCMKPTCRKPEPHGSHGASYTADLAEKAGILTRRFP